jgi:hypothetical protein
MHDRKIIFRLPLRHFRAMIGKTPDGHPTRTVTWWRLAVVPPMTNPASAGLILKCTDASVPTTNNFRL